MAASVAGLLTLGAVVAAPAGAQDLPVAFEHSVLAGESSAQPTSLQFGPDGRLYVAQFNGLVKVYEVVRDGPNAYRVVATETIDLVQKIPNHNDDGALNAGVGTRLVTGLLVAGTAASPVLYVTSSDPRIGAGESGADLNLDTNSGVLSRLVRSGGAWSKLDLVRGLPRSEENHAANGMALDAASNTLFIAQGGNTNKGAPSNNFALLPEYELSAAILSVDLDAIGSSTYDLPTRNGGSVFGGADGVGQAKIVAGGPVQVYAPGFRNPYDVAITKAGRMYTIDNGGNAGWGDIPVDCTNTPREPGTSDPDVLHLVTPNYYGGHPNPNRAAVTGDSRQCNYIGPNAKGLQSFGSSTNGLAEYTASNFGTAVKGDLIAAGWAFKQIYRIDVNASGTVDGVTNIASDTRYPNNPGSLPLDVTAQGDAGPFPGTLWVADQGSSNILIYEPTVCKESTTGDRDGDGYSDADEAAAGTNPCSPADVPHDADGDRISDRTDPDDDNDGQLDTCDPFALDARNGLGTDLPVRYGFDSGGNDPGLLNLGFTGLMTNGKSDYLTLFDERKITARGAAGVFTVDEPTGRPAGSANNLHYGFQFGINPRGMTRPFTVRTRVAAPFAGATPQAGASMGMFIGSGTQDDYLQVAVTGDQGGGVAVVKESAGNVVPVAHTGVALPGPSSIDLYLTVDPVRSIAQASYAVNSPSAAGARVVVGDVVFLPLSWLIGSQGLAVGVVATPGSAPVSATWDLIEVVQGGTLPADVAGDRTAPKLGKLRLRPPRFRAARPGRGPTGTRGTRVRFRLSERATVRFRVQRRQTGPRVRGACRARDAGRRAGRRSVHYRYVRGSFARTGRVGLNTVRFRGRLRNRRLRPGRYRLVAVATDPAGNRSRPRRSSFRIVRR